MRRIHGDPDSTPFAPRRELSGAAEIRHSQSCISAAISAAPLVVRRGKELRVQADMPMLRDRRQSLRDGGPVLTLVIAEEDFAVGRAGEERESTRIRLQGYR